MKVIFRADASFQIGTGHIMRCLTLAGELREKGVEVFFICRLLPGNLCDLIEQKGYFVYRLPYLGQPLDSVTHYAQLLGVNWESDAEETKAILKKEAGVIDWLVVDHYALDMRWETQLRPLVKNIMVIDDLANRPHDCDLILDQNLHEKIEIRYGRLTPSHCRRLLGPNYALLRPEFRATRKKLRVRDGNIRRILIFFGGSDPVNETTKALKSILLLNRPDIAVDVVVGYTNPHKEQIKHFCAAIPNATFYCQIDNIAQLMSNADLSIGAGGSATWERCCLGLPSLIIALAQNQEAIAVMSAKSGTGIFLGTSKDVHPSLIKIEIEKLLAHPNIMFKLSEKAAKLVDGKGAIRVCHALLESPERGLVS